MKTTTGILLLSVLLPLAGCGTDDTSGSDAPISSGTPTSSSPAATSEPDEPHGQPRLVATWSEGQARDQVDWMKEHLEPRLWEGEEIEEFLADVPEALDRQELDDVDPASTSLLVAGFSECANAGAASVADGTVTYVVRKTDDHACVWAPLRVQVFAVPPGVTLAE